VIGSHTSEQGRSPQGLRTPGRQSRRNNAEYPVRYGSHGYRNELGLATDRVLFAVVVKWLSGFSVKSRLQERVLARVRVSFPRLRDLGVLDRERVLASPGPSSRPGTAVASLPPPGRSSSLRSGRSTWTCGSAGGRVAATGECPVLPRDSARLDRGPEGMPALALGFMVVAGPGVACPKSWCAGCEPAALDAESFPGCPPGPVTEASAACRAPAWRRAKMASLIRRLRDRTASLCVFPSASFFS
jgi:hypothetical protein